jgi:hypothetical protein
MPPAPPLKTYRIAYNNIEYGTVTFPASSAEEASSLLENKLNQGYGLINKNNVTITEIKEEQ